MLDDTSDDVAGAGLSASCCFQKLLRVIHGRTRFNCCHNAASREPTHTCSTQRLRSRSAP